MQESTRRHDCWALGPPPDGWLAHYFDNVHIQRIGYHCRLIFVEELHDASPDAEFMQLTLVAAYPAEFDGSGEPFSKCLQSRSSLTPWSGGG